MPTITTTVTTDWGGVEVRWYLGDDPEALLATATKAAVWIADDVPAHLPVLVDLTHQSLNAHPASVAWIRAMATAKLEGGRLVGRARFA
jgi:hypothetical protein